MKMEYLHIVNNIWQNEECIFLGLEEIEPDYHNAATYGCHNCTETGN